MRYIVMLIICVSLPSQVLGDTVRLAAGLTIEPYIIDSRDSGFEADIVKEAFALEGYNVEFVYQPLRRTKVSYASGTVDGVLTSQEHYPEIQDSFLSDEYITYHNCAITLQVRHLKINTIADLKGKVIDAFQQARSGLGREFYLMAENNPGYKEMANQKNQIRKLFANRNDVIILDHRIFKYYRNQLKELPGIMMKDITFEEPVTYHAIFEPSRYKVAFKTEKIRDSFNVGLKNLVVSGRYIKIIESYLKE